MPHINLEQNIESSAPYSGEHQPVAEPSRLESIRRTGKTALALVGATLMLSGAAALESPSSFAAGLPITRTLAPNIQAPVFDPSPPALQPVSPIDPPDGAVYNGPEVGVATPGLGSDDGGSPQLYSDAVKEGFMLGRLTVPVENPGPILPGVRAQIALMLANGMEPAIVLQQSLNQSPDTYPQEAAQLAAELPRANIFILGNEWNSPYFSQGLTLPQILRLTYLANQAVLAARPDAETSALALASGFGQVAFMAAATPIVNQLYGGWKNMGTVVDFHYYRTLATDVQMLKADEQYDHGSIEVGEIGWPVGTAPGAVSPAQQATNEVSWLATISQDPQIVRNIFYRFEDSPDDPFKTANILADGTELPSYGALQFDLTGK